MSKFIALEFFQPAARQFLIQDGGEPFLNKKLFLLSLNYPISNLSAFKILMSKREEGE